MPNILSLRNTQSNPSRESPKGSRRRALLAITDKQSLRSYLTSVLSAVCRQEARSVRPYLQSPGTAARLTAGAFLPQLIERGEIEEERGKERRDR